MKMKKTLFGNGIVLDLKKEDPSDKELLAKTLKDIHKVLDEKSVQSKISLPHTKTGYMWLLPNDETCVVISQEEDARFGVREINIITVTSETTEQIEQAIELHYYVIF